MNTSERYIRQILVRDFGGAAQKKLTESHIGLIGLGGIGAPTALYLVGAGVGKITVFEFDVISTSNLHRQVLFSNFDVGRPKIEVGIEKLRSLNPNVEIIDGGKFQIGNEPSVEKLDLLIDGSDNLATRHLANRYAFTQKIPLLSASLAQWEGQIAHFSPPASACYHCLVPETTDPNSLPSCSELGVIGAVAGVIGTMTSLEAIKILTQSRGALPLGEMLLYDGSEMESRRIKIAKRGECAVCGTPR